MPPKGRRGGGGGGKKGKQIAKKQLKLPEPKPQKEDTDTDMDLSINIKDTPKRKKKKGPATGKRKKRARDEVAAADPADEENPPADEENPPADEENPPPADENLFQDEADDGGGGDASDGADEQEGEEVEGEIYLHIFHMLFMFSYLISLCSFFNFLSVENCQLTISFQPFLNSFSTIFRALHHIFQLLKVVQKFKPFSQLIIFFFCFLIFHKKFASAQVTLWRTSLPSNYISFNLFFNFIHSYIVII